MTYNIDTREFTVYYTEGLGLAAPNEIGTDYYIDVIAEGPKGVGDLTTSFVLTIKNPCYDPNYVEFPVPVKMPPLVKYRLAEGKVNSPLGIQIADQTLLKVLTKPVETPLCQEGIEYEILYLGTPVTTISSPARLEFNTMDELQVSYYTEEVQYLGYTTLTVRAIYQGFPIRRNLQTNNPPL